MSENEAQPTTGSTPRRTSAAELERKRTAYAAAPEKFRTAARLRRRLQGGKINERRRQLAAAKRHQYREAAWEKFRQHPPNARLPWHVQLSKWWLAQPLFDSKRRFAAAVGVSVRQVFDWLRGFGWPDRPRRQKLHEVTGLACFAVSRKEKRPERGAEERAAAVVKALALRCGLANRQIRKVTVSQIEKNGIRIGDRLIRFGPGRHQVDRIPLEQWLSMAKPAEFLFFQLKPVNRLRPTSAHWVIRMLGASGVEAQERRGAHVAHFAEDGRRFGVVGGRLLHHLRTWHGLSKSGARGILVRAVSSEPTGTEIAERSGPGRPAEETADYRKARQMRAAGKTYPEIARLLRPKEYRKNPRRAAKALAMGVARLKV